MTEIIGAGTPADRLRLPLATRQGRTIPNEKRQEQLPARRRAAVGVWQTECPEARIRSATAVYNCMGLIFASRRTWIEPRCLDFILKDDEYHRLAGPDEAQTGDIVVYRNGGDHSVSHLGVIVDIERQIRTGSRKITVMSQWGADGEYLHPIDHVPALLGEPGEYWTDRRPIP